MLKYTTTAVTNEDGIVSPGHPSDLDYTRRHIEVSAGSKAGTKMAIKKSRGGMRRILAKEQREIQFKNQVCSIYVVLNILFQYFSKQC